MKAGGLLEWLSLLQRRAPVKKPLEQLVLPRDVLRAVMSEVRERQEETMGPMEAPSLSSMAL